MTRKQIKPRLWGIFAVDEAIRGFRNDSFTEHGMMYNSYLLETQDGLLLIGAPPARYLPEWLDSIKTIAKDRTVKWFALHGTHDDRAAAEAVLRVYPDLTLIGGANVLYQLEGRLESMPGSIQVRGKRSLVLGGRELIFQTLPGKTGTSQLYILDRNAAALFTADAFGADYADEGVLTSRIADTTGYLHGAAQYYSDIDGRNRRQTMESAVQLVRENGITTLCPSIGPAVDTLLEELLHIYEDSAPKQKTQPAAALFYTPGGYVAELMSCIASGITDSGNITAETVDLSAVGRESAIQKAAGADALLFGTTDTAGAGKPIWDIATSLRPDACQGKIAASVYSTQSTDGNPAPFRAFLAALGFDMNTPDSVVRGKPDSQSLNNAYEYGFAIGCSLLKIPNPHRPKLVKCLVCGEIFEASLGSCPVCGVGLDQCIPVDQELVTFRKDTNHRYVILGGGIAAVSAAEAIRLRDRTGSITILSAENYLPINRPMLTKDLAALAKDPDSIRIHDRAWYEERTIALHLGVRAVSLCPEKKTVAATDGAEYSYDKLVYATGAECFVPPFAGYDKQGVITIRHLWDSRELQSCLDAGAKRAVVIGGGVLGLEAASELMRAGVKVTVLEAAPQIVGRQIDSASAAILKAAMEGLGVACWEGVSIAGIEGEERASGVRLADGRVFPADFVIVSCGTRGNVGPAKEAGIAVERAIVVNERMETNLPDIYACGDCAQFAGINYQLWQEASSQGKVAGANAAGDWVAYANQSMGLSLEGFGTSLFAVGDPGKKADVPYKTVETTDGVTGRHEKYWFYGGRLEGAVILGAPEKTVDISQAVASHARYTELF